MSLETENRDEYRAGGGRRIADLSSDDRPREKALAKGIRVLSDAELLAILIGGGVPGKSAIDLAREMLDACGNSINQLAMMPIRTLSRRFNGIGPAKAITIAAAIELGSRRNAVGKDFKIIRMAVDAVAVLRPNMENLPTEEFWALFLRRNNSVICAERISSGGIAATYVEPKMIMKKALDVMASSVIVAHNHPSGNLKPSKSDDELTRKIKAAAETLDIRLLDHVIITTAGHYSYADNGCL